MTMHRPSGDCPTLKSWIRANAPHVSAGIVAADAMNYGEAIDSLEKAGLSFLHFDIMDGVFCPLLTAGPGLVKGLKTTMLKDVHLMVTDPLVHIASFVAAGADILHIHAESPHLHHTLSEIDICAATHPILRGVALNPGTPLEALMPVLHLIDIVTILAIDPGWSTTLHEETLKKRMTALRSLLSEAGADPLICIDGGITPATYPKAAALMPDLIVSGSALFKKGATVAQNLEALRGSSS